MRAPPAALWVIALAAAACARAAGPVPEARSLLDRDLYAPAIADDARTRMEMQLAEARAAWSGTADDVEGLIWVGRRTAYLGRFREAIAIFSDGIARHPEDARLYRHRGHRYLTVRELDRAVADFAKAAALVDGTPDQVEPDGQPNARNIPTSTLHSNIWYHFALARYLQRDFAGAAEAWMRARAAVDNPDNIVAASHWLYLSLRRAGRGPEAAAVLEPVRADLDVIENRSYLTLLLMYRGEKTPEAVLADAGEGSSGSAVRYGVGAWYLIQGREAEARTVWTRMIEQPDWPSFGHLAAEAELRAAR